MKLIFLFLLIFHSLNGQIDRESIRTTLLENFPEGIWFVYEDLNGGNSENSLSLRFHQPEVDFTENTLRLSYIKEMQDWDNDLLIERMERIIPLKCIIENYIFEMNWGQNDWFSPGLHYWYFDVEEDCGAEVNIYRLNPKDWNQQIPDENLNEIEIRNFWFPTSKEAGEELDDLFRNLK